MNNIYKKLCRPIPLEHTFRFLVIQGTRHEQNQLSVLPYNHISLDEGINKWMHNDNNNSNSSNNNKDILF
jgi:hypothetical protein